MVEYICFAWMYIFIVHSNSAHHCHMAVELELHPATWTKLFPRSANRVEFTISSRALLYNNSFLFFSWETFSFLILSCHGSKCNTYVKHLWWVKPWGFVKVHQWFNFYFSYVQCVSRWSVKSCSKLTVFPGFQKQVVLTRGLLHSLDNGNC